MGRAGGGGGGGGRSGGSRSSSRSGGGHRSSSRSGSGSFHSGRSSSRMSHSSFGRTHSRHHYSGSMSMGSSYPATYRRRTTSGYSLALSVIIMLTMLVLMVTFTSLVPSTGFISTRNREKINSNIAYKTNCIVDELYWFDNPSYTGKKLEYFYEKTGIQPYIVLLDYDESLKTDADKLEYAEQYYEDNFDNESTFLFMYFAEEDVEGDVGFMCYMNGYQCNSVMDDEAVEIFWNYIDSYWYSDMSTDDLFIKAFSKTADTIMTKSRTFADVAWVFGIIALVGISGCVIVVVMNKKRKAEKEKAEETERILKASMNDLQQQSRNDDLVNKYN